ncbi:hypothetical protein [Stieleria mannarensis]|uniref:hypothetical protein n=1 Tax=Stieleria mannarensis TaxID=2755585 RepID=UPI0015FFB839|nr:hypothetical protein [Rhodopirellula sp. JC639]
MKTTVLEKKKREIKEKKWPFRQKKKAIYGEKQGRREKKWAQSPSSKKKPLRLGSMKNQKERLKLGDFPRRHQSCRGINQDFCI